MNVWCPENIKQVHRVNEPIKWSGRMSHSAKANVIMLYKRWVINPQTEMCRYLFSIYFYISNVVLKNCGHVDFRELVLAEDNQQACFTTGTITNYHQLLSDGSHFHRFPEANRTYRLIIYSLPKSVSQQFNSVNLCAMSTRDITKFTKFWMGLERFHDIQCWR